MKKKSKIREGACIYCGVVGTLTKDHVPPRNLFPKPHLGLITVPSCAGCNGSFKLDDEYFRLAITTGVDPKEFPIAVEAIFTGNVFSYRATCTPSCPIHLSLFYLEESLYELVCVG